MGTPVYRGHPYH
jgi:hypothetical protein